MENFKFKPTDKNYNLVHGSTTINHRIRVKLGLTCNEYVVMSFIHNHIADEINPKLVEVMTKETGFNLAEFVIISQEISDKGMLYEEVATSKYVLPPNWTREFDVSADFEEFWNEIYKKHGNRVESLAKYIQTRKIVDKETLHARAAKYIATRDQFPEFTKAAQVYLNPKKQYWNDLLPGDSKPAADKMEGTIFNK